MYSTLNGLEQLSVFLLIVMVTMVLVWLVILVCLSREHEREEHTRARSVRSKLPPHFGNKPGPPANLVMPSPAPYKAAKR
ncbi:hypothetical protein AciPR4_3092 [Terriglobus saanensis SP1PR4]|uniref:Uncharacterized protein n=1 Tax=Terriglobus saanensis (strain ATCC BAA-1853 / DSM 23119 / SP1PR4) TaxID=401053 RepID=E8V6P9_TERSS|nr:hypothetical protein AciPR4_3092 [Terriglobus saanensis SP1PR4]